MQNNNWQRRNKAAEAAGFLPAFAVHMAGQSAQGGVNRAVINLTGQGGFGGLLMAFLRPFLIKGEVVILPIVLIVTWANLAFFEELFYSNGVTAFIYNLVPFIYYTIAGAIGAGVGYLAGIPVLGIPFIALLYALGAVHMVMVFIGWILLLIILGYGTIGVVIFTVVTLLALAEMIVLLIIALGFLVLAAVGSIAYPVVYALRWTFG